MAQKIAIKQSSLRTRSPVGAAILWWLLLGRLNAPQWAYGVLWTVVAVAAIAFIHCLCTTVERDVPGFGEKK